MTAPALSPMSAEEYGQHLANVDAAQILDRVLDLHPLDGCDDEELRDREDQR